MTYLVNDAHLAVQALQTLKVCMVKEASKSSTKAVHQAVVELERALNGAAAARLWIVEAVCEGTISPYPGTPPLPWCPVCNSDDEHCYLLGGDRRPEQHAVRADYNDTVRNS